MVAFQEVPIIWNIKFWDLYTGAPFRVGMRSAEAGTYAATFYIGDYIGIMEKKMETTTIMGLYRVQGSQELPCLIDSCVQTTMSIAMAKVVLGDRA